MRGSEFYLGVSLGDGVELSLELGSLAGLVCQLSFAMGGLLLGGSQFAAQAGLAPLQALNLLPAPASFVSRQVPCSTGLCLTLQDFGSCPKLCIRASCTSSRKAVTTKAKRDKRVASLMIPGIVANQLDILSVRPDQLRQNTNDCA